MLSRINRIQGEREVAKVYRRGQGVRAGQLSLKHAPNNLDRTRLGVVISKKVSKSSPVRNRVRRRIYEYFRLNLSRLQSGQDIIISVFSAELAELPSTALANQLDELVKRAGLWVDPPAA